MNNKFFKQIYDISTCVLKENNNIEDNLINIDSSKYILKKTEIEKSNIKFYPYLFKHEKIGSLEVDEDYNFKLNNSKLVYESGLILSYIEDDKEWTIDNLFLSESDNEESGMLEYDKLLSMINDNNIDKLCEMIVEYLKK